ncbi:MAG: 3'(2'),5'-bisphosphate nucleotidase CysQ [Ekhidna sp.]|nr:3'(2'),5'-bisphosphate nucleotidase CysQ [Ekhidna sp.]
MRTDLRELLSIAKEASLAAGREIIRIYETGDFSIKAKSDDSPLTKADTAAHQKITSILKTTNLPIISEEGKEIPYDERSKWEHLWMVDPLDGTKEFIKRNGEFTVNIALIHHNKPILGVVYPPVLKDLYWAVIGGGSFLEKNGESTHLNTTGRYPSDSGLKVVTSRSHISTETEEYLKKLNQPKIVSKGSSLKFLLVASGEADLYPRFGPTMEWDTAAAHIIVSEAGGRVVLENKDFPLTYNKKNLLNPNFIVLPR